MADTTFTNSVTLTDAEWFNDLNRLHYTILGDPASLAALLTTIEAGKACFFAHKNGTDQTSVATGTKITFGTESWDTGSHFDTSTSRWTPPAGKYRISGAVQLTTGVTDQGGQALVLYRSGVEHRRLQTNNAAVDGSIGLSGSVIVDADGTHYFELFHVGQTVTITGGAAITYFCGERI